MTKFAEAKPFLDLRRHHFARDVGDVSIFGTWVPRPEADDQSEPALVLIPRFRTRDFHPFVLCLSAAYKYQDPRYLAYAAKIALESLGFEDTMQNAIKIANLINDHMSDLISMPPEPTEAVVVGEATAHMPDGTKRTIEILDHDPARL